MMASSPAPIYFATSPSSTTVRIPFEYSQIMDECRVEVLKKFKKEITEQVRFSDVSSTLIACGLVSKDECFELCKLSGKKQMQQCFQKVHDIMDILVCQHQGSLKQKALSSESGERTDQQRQTNTIGSRSNHNHGLVKNIWDNFLLSLKKEHLSLATKMENELYKCAENKLVLKKTRRSVSSGGSLKVKKEDIGSPTDFQHVKHYGLKSSTSSLSISQGIERGGGQQSPITRVIDSLEILDENDPDLQEFFKRAGVLERHLANDLTKQIIINFIAEHGGMETIRREVRKPHSSIQSEMTTVTDNLPTDEKAEATKSRENENTTDFQKENKEETLQGKAQCQPAPPATVPFEPTPKPPASNLYYF